MKTYLHPNFKLNGNSFDSVEALLEFSQGLSFSVNEFLKEWFSNDATVEVQTSGSTGKPKLIRLKKEFMINSAKATGKFFNLPEKTTALLCLSVDYIAGKMMLVRAITLGWHLDMVTTSTKVSVKKQYDFSAMVPLQLRNSLTELSKIKNLIVGGGVVANDLLLKIQDSSTSVYATYGMTETITHIAIKKLNNFDKTFEVYKTLPDVSIYIDERSCLCIKAPKISDDFIVTNDVVQLISDREFEWLGRYDNVINSGGVKLHPERIEEKLSKIIEARFFVIGIPDKFLGEKLILVVEGVSKEIDLKDCNLSKFEKPKEIYFIERFVETETKKIQRNKTLDLITL